MPAAINPHRPCKLTAEQVKQIRQNRTGLPAWRLAELFGVHVRTIDSIRSYRSWAHIINL